jgi:anti-sigma factor RsiW
MDERQVGGLWCSEVLEDLDAFVDGSLAPATLACVREHVLGCSQCARFGAAYARLVTALRAGPSEGLDEARLQRLHRRLAEVP